MPVWLYRFDYVAENSRIGATAALHASEIPFLFNTLKATSFGDKLTKNDQMAALNFSLYVINFVKTGRPNGPGLPHWPKFNPVKLELMLFTSESGPLVRPYAWKDRLDLVERTADRTKGHH